MRRVSNIRAGFTLAECATHVAHCNNSRKQGFTLAEVLITLGIIGVVAAMTMPTLMNSTQGAQYKAAYKKALSAISQGVTLNVALDGNDFYDATAGSAGNVDSETTIAGFLNKRMNIVRHPAEGDKGYTIKNGSADLSADTNNTALFFNDGSVFVFPATESGCTKDRAGVNDHICKGYIDVNGAKGPNKVVTCSSGSGDSCEAKNPTDVYPVKFYDQTILPNSPAARAVLYGK